MSEQQTLKISDSFGDIEIDQSSCVSLQNFDGDKAAHIARIICAHDDLVTLIQRFVDIAKRPSGWTLAEHARSIDATISISKEVLAKTGVIQ